MKKLLVTAAVVAVVALTQVALAAGSQPQGTGFITDTLGGNGHAKVTHGYRLITDTLAPGGGSGAPLAGVASDGQSFNWGDAGIGAAGAIGTALVLIGGSLVVLRKRGRLAI
jgi:hypothetical protein